MNLMTDRTPQMIAVEINSIKDQTRKMVLYNSIEIGRRLVEAKTMIGHGEWGKWLEESVNYSQSTANNLMRIFDEYGSNQLAFFDNNAKSQALGNLSYTQAVVLLGIPEEEREQFVETNDIHNMSTRELQQAIKERDEALKERDRIREEKESLGDELVAKESDYLMLADEKEMLEKRLEDRKETIERISNEKNKLIAETSNLKVTIHQTEQTVERLKEELSQAKESESTEDGKVAELEKELAESQSLIETLRKELEAPQVVEASIIEKVPEEIEKELNSLREKVKEVDQAKADQQNDKAVMKFTVQFETLVKGFGDLLTTLNEMMETDPENHSKYKKAVSGLIGKMTERL